MGGRGACGGGVQCNETEHQNALTKTFHDKGKDQSQDGIMQKESPWGITTKQDRIERIRDHVQYLLVVPATPAVLLGNSPRVLCKGKYDVSWVMSAAVAMKNDTIPAAMATPPPALMTR